MAVADAFPRSWIDIVFPNSINSDFINVPYG